MTLLNDTAVAPEPARKESSSRAQSSRPQRAYTIEELRSKHNTADSLFIAFEGRVFDVTQFANGHPGGVDILLQFAGEDVTTVMKDASIHKHSKSAFNILKNYCVGWLADGYPHSDNGTTHQEGEQFDTTTTANDTTDTFLDLSQPLLPQMWHLKIGKEEYLRQIHRPRYLSYTARMFASPFLEPFTRTPWYLIPILWLPVSYWLVSSTVPAIGTNGAATWFIGGLLGWTLFEYIAHRFFFHADNFMPDRPGVLTVHFLLHGIHHFLPMDRLRLVFPPLLAIAIAIPVYSIFAVSMLQAHANASFAGLMLGYIIYDLTHYFLHHGRPVDDYFRGMKTYHLDHHFKNENLGYGVTSKFWDIVFGTTLRVTGE